MLLAQWIIRGAMGLQFGSVVMCGSRVLWSLPGAFRLPWPNCASFLRAIFSKQPIGREGDFFTLRPGGVERPRLDPELLEEEHGGQRDPEQ